jgi:hypothetical protein
MWDYVLNTTTSPDWLVSALGQGMAIFATDRTYGRKQGPNHSGAGWVIACHKSEFMLKGSFFKFSSDTRSYRGELLGLAALNTLDFHASRYYKPTTVGRKFICNSKSALYKLSKKGCRRIRPGTAQVTCFGLCDQSFKKCQDNMNG